MPVMILPFYKGGRGSQSTSGIQSPTISAPALHSHRSPKFVRFYKMEGFWSHLMRPLRSPTICSTSSISPDSTSESQSGASHVELKGQSGSGDGVVNVVVVDRDWSEGTSYSLSMDDISTPELPSRHFHIDTGHTLPFLPNTLIASDRSFGFYKWNIWTRLADFFHPRFSDEKLERHFQQESWGGVHKRIAQWSCLFLLLNWIIGCAFTKRHPAFIDILFHFVVSPLLNLPLLFMVMWDLPYTRPRIYQVYLWATIWSSPFYVLFYMYFCGYYDPGKSLFSCRKDFMAVFYYASALPSIALFGLKMRRSTAFFGAFSYCVISCALIIPKHTRWARHMLDCVLYLWTVIYIHYMIEQGERRLYILRESLKAQFKATQKAQVNERKAADSKRRLTSYVRVPLNTALLALQNMQALETFDTFSEEKGVELTALNSSLSMMSQVLDDVLDFNRMDSGRFECASRPYEFHTAMRTLSLPLHMAASTRNLTFEVQLDQKIDEIASREALRVYGEKYSGGQAPVVGDETRLRQIITNLASNAFKFTPSGGKISISTHLVWPLPIPDASKPLDQIVVRVEVTDTGFGIDATEMEQSKLFSAFNQTDRGRQQGGKGTGLGLALVRQIVKHSGGRLGMRSQLGRGSTFWVELPLGVGSRVRAACEDPSTGGLNIDHRSTNETTVDVQSVESRTHSDRPTRSISVDSRPGQVRGHSPPVVLRIPLNTRDDLPGVSNVDQSVTTQPIEEYHHDNPVATAATNTPLHKKCSLQQKSSFQRIASTAFPPDLDVLVVDDDPLTRTLMNRLLTRLGCNVSLAENGQIALDMLGTKSSDKEKYAVVFLDNQMPVLDGPKAVARLRAIGRQDFIVGVTGNALRIDQEAYLEAGVNYVLTKPVLEASLRSMLALAHSRRQISPGVLPAL